MAGLIDALSFLGKRQVTAMRGLLAYLSASPGLFEAVGVQEKHIHTEEDLQAIHRAN
jgi:hypothetical protein